ncbi:MAG TPA: hypothetical protein DD827_07405 [Gammaproteobacteria bacterium]|nr:hypothetical protein [Gammaproteobacteria bacterium]
MIKRLMIEDGVLAVTHFKDDGEFLEGYGMMDEPKMRKLSEFCHDYSRLVQSNADQLSMFTSINAWTPPRGWMVKGKNISVFCVGNIACLVEAEAGNINDIFRQMQDLASY